MLIDVPRFEYLSCETMSEVFSLLSRYGEDSKILAGGTDLLVKMKHRKILPRRLISVKRISDLHGIRLSGTGLRIGAMTPVEEIRKSPIISNKYSIIIAAAGKLGTTHIRNLATIGGNIANASPAAEFATPLLALNARVKAISSRGERVLSLEEFFVGPGKSILQKDEILCEIFIPDQPLGKGIYLKHSTRPMDVAIVNVAINAHICGEMCERINIALGAVGPTPFRCKKAENIIRENYLNMDLKKLAHEAAQIAVEESRPIRDLRASAEQRAEVIRCLVTKGLEQTLQMKKNKRV